MKGAVWLALALSLTGCGPSKPAIAGTATYVGEPLPAEATLEVTLVELAGAGAPGRVLGSVLVGGAGRSPIAFRLPYDPAEVDTTRGYAVRARVLADRSVLYLSDSAPPVLTRGYGRVAAVSLIPATVTRQLPATFTGTLPCDRCAGVVYQIDLLPDSVFYLRAVRQGAGDSSVRVDIGRWTLEAGGARLLLEGSSREAFAPFGASVLRPVDAAGRPVASGRGHELLRTGTVPPLQPELPLRGLYRETDAGALFADCRTGRPMPVSPGGDRRALEAAYRRAGGRREVDILVRLDGRIERQPASPMSTLSVRRFLGASRVERC